MYVKIKMLTNIPIYEQVNEKLIVNVRLMLIVVATTIRNDPFNYNEAILGRPAQDYINWILKPNSWGTFIFSCSSLTFLLRRRY